MLMVPFTIVGIVDMLQTKNTIIRNFPVFGHIRYLALSISPEIRHYFVENNINGTPFSKNQRDFVNKRANNEAETHPFGTELDVYGDKYTWAAHSVYPKEVLKKVPLVAVGEVNSSKPYQASIFNISAMSYGSLSAAAVRALNKGAAMGDFLHNTGEGGLTDYHTEFGADLIWEIGSAYFGCRTPEGEFESETFKEKASRPEVKMVELKLSQGAKPGHGGVLPAVKNTKEIAKIRGLEPHTKVVSPAYHTAFSDAEGLLEFVEKLRELSGGKPAGFKLCIGRKQEFIDICEAMLNTGIKPDFITLDGSEGGTGASPIELSDSIGMPLEEALVFATDSLRGYNLKKDITIIASGKVITGFDIIKTVALGADITNSARGMMFALGCIQALKCDTNDCPTGVTTQKPELTRGLVVKDKAERVKNFHEKTIEAALQLLAGIGFESFDDLKRKHIIKRTAPEIMKSYEELYPSVEVGSYL